MHKLMIAITVTHNPNPIYRTHISGDISADISGDIWADIRAEISADISADIWADISADILADISADISADTSADISADISADVQSLQLQLPQPLQWCCSHGRRLMKQFAPHSFGLKTISQIQGVCIYIYIYIYICYVICVCAIGICVCLGCTESTVQHVAPCGFLCNLQLSIL